MYGQPFPSQPYPAASPYGGGYPGGQQPPPYAGSAQMRQPQVCLSWVPASGGQIPQRAVPAGNGVYVSRARHGSELIPGKVANGHGCAFVAYGGQEHSIPTYEVLCDSGMPCFGCGFAWVPCQGHNIPPNAIVGGHTAGNEPLYIGKGIVNGDPVVGKVYAPHQCAYFPWGGKEHPSKQFEVLVSI